MILKWLLIKIIHMFGNTNLHKFQEPDQYDSSVVQSNLMTITTRRQSSLSNKLQNYHPQSDLIDIDKLRSSPYLKLKAYKQYSYTYYGQIINGKRHGLGIMMYSKGRVYEGGWAGDYKNGEGYQCFENGCVFQGNYVNGKPEGVGKYTWPNGQLYQGEWLNGQKHGIGTWQGEKGDSYVGQWKFGKAEGFGVHVWVNGDRYEGEFKQCLKHGSGLQRYSNGDIYKGQFYKGKPYGFGEYYWIDGCYYKGQFKKGKRHGAGVWRKTLGDMSDKYEGQYIEDKKEGYGIFTWGGGNVFKGNYKNDKRQGYGEMYWADGSYYKGSWRGGAQQGEGIIYVPREGIKKGIFRDNQLVETHLEEEAVIHVPIVIKRKNFRRTRKSISDKVIIAVNLQSNRKTQSKLQHESLNVDSSSPDNRKKTAKGHGYNSYANMQHKQFMKTSRDYSTNKFEYRYKKRLELWGKNSPTLKEEKKEKTPHSSVFMHRIQKRILALGQAPNPNSAPRRYQTHSQQQDYSPLPLPIHTSNEFA